MPADSPDARPTDASASPDVPPLAASCRPTTLPHRWAAATVVGLLGLIETLKHFLPVILRDDLFHSDALQHVFWTYRYIDPGLFPGDPIADFMSRSDFTPPGYTFLMKTFAPLIDPQRFVESCVVVLGMFMWVIAFDLGRRIDRGRWLGGAVAVGVLVYYQHFQHLHGGFARSWSMPLLLLGVWALVARNQIVLGIAGFVSVLMYPPTVIVLGPAALATLVIRGVRERRMPRHWAALAVFCVVSLAIIYVNYLRPLPPELGPRVNRQQAMQMYEFGRNGISAFWPTEFGRDAHVGLGGESFKWFWFEHHRSSLDVGMKTAAWLAVIFVATAVFLRRAVPLPIWMLLLGSIFVFFLAHATLFKLYLPNRHVRFAFPLVGMFWAAGVFPRLADEIAWRLPAARELVARAMSGRVWMIIGLLAIPTTAAFAVAEIAIYSQTGVTHRLTKGLHANSYPQGIEDAYAYLRTLPKDTLVAAFPLDADLIPLRARRPVLVNRETSFAYYLGYYKPIPAKMNALLSAYWSDNWAELDALHDRFGVDVMLVNRRRFHDPVSWYFNPMNDSHISALGFETQKMDFTRYALLRPDPSRVLFRQGEVTIVRLGPPRPSATPIPPDAPPQTPPQ